MDRCTGECETVNDGLEHSEQCRPLFARQVSKRLDIVLVGQSRQFRHESSAARLEADYLRATIEAIAPLFDQRLHRKTLLARAVAGESGVPFFSISASEFIEKHETLEREELATILGTAAGEISARA
jgi:hypothetical protein